MKYLTLETFTDFFCIGSECPFTCCRDWKITIDEETDRFYQSVDGEMGKCLKKYTNHKDGKAWFALREEDNHCHFLNEKGLCSIVINLGEEHLSNTCAHYPRYMFCEGDICFTGVSISCPEVSRLLIKHEQPLLIDFAEFDDDTNVDRNTNWGLFNHAIRAFTTAVSIAQNRSFSAKERIALVLIFINGFQASVDDGSDPSSLISVYSNPSNYYPILDQTGISTCDLESKLSFSTGIRYFFKSVSSLEAKLPELAEQIEYFDNPENSFVDSVVWEKAFEKSMSSNNDIWMENVLVYILFRYFMKGLSEKDFYEKVTTSVGAVLCMSTCIIALYSIIHDKTPTEDYIILLVSKLSRFIEHNELVHGELTEFFNKTGFKELGFFLKYYS